MDAPAPEPAFKRLRFRDVDGREYDVDQLLGVPPHVAIKILVNIDNFLTLYNFSMSSHKARDFMERHQVFQQWDAKWFGPDLEIRRRVVDRFNRPTAAKNSFRIRNKYTITYDFNQSDEGISVHVMTEVWNESVPNTLFAPLVQAVRRLGTNVRETPEVSYWAGGSITNSIKYRFTCDTDTKLAQLLYVIFEFASQNNLRELYEEENTEYGSTAQILAFHACLRVFSKNRGQIYLRTSDDVVDKVIDARDIEWGFRRNYLRIVDALEAGGKIFVDDRSDPSVRFIKSSCTVCSQVENVTHKCDTCHSPMHNDCWVSSKHEKTCINLIK